MITEAQLIANRINALKSTGPTSPEGKRVVRMNAATHGYAGHTVVLHSHEIPAYEEHFASFRSEYKPVGPTEQFLVQSLADLAWSAQQIRADITTASAQAGSRHLHETAASGDERIDTAIAQGRSLDDRARTLNTRGMYEQRKMRLFHTTRKELIQVQAERKAQEQKEIAEAAEMRRADNLSRQPGEPERQPSENGFVCSLQQVDRYIVLEDRLNRFNSPRKAAA
jgi:hypothetical protein